MSLLLALPKGSVSGSGFTAINDIRARLPQLRGCASHWTMQELTLRKEEIGNALPGATATRED